MNFKLFKYFLLLVVGLAVIQSANGQKRGICPETQTCSFKNYLKSVLLNIIFGNCKDDSSCTGQTKCCQFSCDQSFCLTPVKPTVRPGQCPIPTGPGGCINGCESDDDCPIKSQKCCSNGCGSVCTDPVTVCPIDNTKIYCEVTNHTCSLDSHCQPGFRCCPRNCGNMCIRL
ncbi:unnamed protein product [Brachionus calyciflorus]|uniref:WAP domain-containing protein n=1 Tax=Brachionus calyciflorus TaxID=104777 RepID=A0A813NH71_9BILA|nr:unnamed protein product [Brachionus calyciflorus]